MDKEIKIQGWVTIDEFDYGTVNIHEEYPDCKTIPIADTGDYEAKWKSKGKIYVVDKEFLQTLTFDNSPKKVEIIIRVQKDRNKKEIKKIWK